MNPEFQAKVLIFTDFYLPGEKGGGTIRTVANLIAHLGDRFQFFVITRDQDFAESKPYELDRTIAWHQVGKAQVFYDHEPSFRTLWKKIHEVKPDILHVMSCFSPMARKLLLMHSLGLLPHVPFVVSPLGQFTRGARKLKARRKKFFVKVGNWTGLFNNVSWHASSPEDADDIRTFIGPHRRGIQPSISIASDLPMLPNTAELTPPRKRSGEVRLIFISRIDRKKNLGHALATVSRTVGDVTLDIFGPVEDHSYWQSCLRHIEVMPKHVNVVYRGSLTYAAVIPALSQYHFLLLPTLGENFGHIILESLSAGCPVILSNLTIWRDLERKGVGWDLPLTDAGAWDRVLQQCLAMDQAQYDSFSQRARKFAIEWALNPDLLKQSVDLYRSILPSQIKEHHL